jgi:hypothetical protein
MEIAELAAEEVEVDGSRGTPLAMPGTSWKRERGESK